MRYLVTGASGYIGGQMAERLHREGYDILGMVRKKSSPMQFQTIEADLMKPEMLRNACRNVDVVCHFAGALGRGMTDDMIRATNVTGTIHMIKAAKECGVKYFLHISSGAVIGPRKQDPADEETECRPYSIYERTKYEGEKKALSLAREIGLPLCVARPTFTYGPGDPHKLLMFRLIRKGWFFFIGDKNSTNHPVFIDDLINGILLMLEKRPVQEVFILGGPRPVTKLEWAETVAKILGVKPPSWSIPFGLAWFGASLMEPVGRLTGIQAPLTRSRILAMSGYWGMDIGKARRELGYEPRVDLAQGLQRTIEWYQKNEWL